MTDRIGADWSSHNGVSMLRLFDERVLQDPDKTPEEGNWGEELTTRENNHV